jgi:hypothetical protein
MEVRKPDAYTMETLVDSPRKSKPRKSRSTATKPTQMMNSYQDISCYDLSDAIDDLSDELEQAKLESLESWKVEIASKRWESFQSILNRLKRLGMLDNSMKKVYDLLSVLLHDYSYNIDTSITEEEYVFIEKYLHLFRMTPTESANLNETLRVCLKHSS